MAEQYDFIINDESVINSYGFRVLTNGISLAQYKKNPLVLYLHKRGRIYSDNNEERLPIGKAVKLWKEDGKLMASIEFDQEDEFAKKIESKVKGGFLNMASLGATPIEFSDKPKYLLEGQSLKTLIKSELEEISIADFGSNPNALRLYDESHDVIELSRGNANNNIPPIETEEEKEVKLKKQENMDFKEQVCKALGLDSATANEVVLTAIESKVTLAKEAEDYKQKADEAEEQRIVTLVKSHTDKKFTADKEAHFIELGKSVGYDSLSKTFEAMPDMVKPGQFVHRTNEDTEEDEGDKTMTFSKLKEKGMVELMKFKKEKPQEYIQLFKAEYGFEPNLKEED